jgi:hypothetical protein
MTPNPDFGFEQTAKELILGIVDTVADIPGLTKEQRFLKRQTTVSSVMAFRPRDPLQIMLAGHCVIYDAMLRDGARDLLRGQPEDISLRTRPTNLASGRMFLTTLHALVRLQDRETVQPGVTQPAAAASPPVSPPAIPSTVRQAPQPSKVPTAPGKAEHVRVNASERPVTFRSRHFGTVSHSAMTIALAPPTGPVVSKSRDLAAGEFVTVPVPLDFVSAPGLFRKGNESHATEIKCRAASIRVPTVVGGFDGPWMDQQDFHFVTAPDQSPSNHAG